MLCFSSQPTKETQMEEKLIAAYAKNIEAVKNTYAAAEMTIIAFFGPFAEEEEIAAVEAAAHAYWDAQPI